MNGDGDGDDLFEHLLATTEAEAMDLDQLDKKLMYDFWCLHFKSEYLEMNFKNLVKLAGRLYLYRYQVDVIGMDHNVENDLATLFDVVEKGVHVSGQRDQFLTQDDMDFLVALNQYRKGVDAMEDYQKGVRELLRLARIKYEALFEDIYNGMDREVCPFDMFVARFSCMKISYVASHGIISHSQLKSHDLISFVV